MKMAKTKDVPVVLGLVEALRAVYALVGQNKQVRKIIEDAIEEHGI